MLLEPSQVKPHCDEVRSSNRKIIFTNGCFDILHVGHLRYLQQARQLGDYLFVGLNSDESVKGLKGPQRPIQTQEERAEILLGLSCVDAVSIFGEPTPIELIEKVRPDFLVKGGDWPIEKIVGHEFVQSYGGVVQSLPFVPGRSSTGLIEKIQKL